MRRGRLRRPGDLLGRKNRFGRGRRRLVLLLRYWRSESGEVRALACYAVIVGVYAVGVLGLTSRLAWASAREGKSSQSRSPCWAKTAGAKSSVTATDSAARHAVRLIFPLSIAVRFGENVSILFSER